MTKRDVYKNCNRQSQEAKYLFFRKNKKDLKSVFGLATSVSMNPPSGPARESEGSVPMAPVVPIPSQKFVAVRLKFCVHKEDVQNNSRASILLLLLHLTIIIFLPVFFFSNLFFTLDLFRFNPKAKGSLRFITLDS